MIFYDSDTLFSSFVVLLCTYGFYSVWFFVTHIFILGRIYLWTATKTSISDDILDSVKWEGIGDEVALNFVHLDRKIIIKQLSRKDKSI